MSSPSALSLSELVKKFPQSGFCLGPIDLNLALGSRLAVFGKNGAGKSTLFQLLTGHLSPDAGQITILDQRMHPGAFELKRRIGYLPQNLDLPRWVSAFDLITYALKLADASDLGAKRQASLHLWDCTSFAHKPLAACSYGMQKRVGLALATLIDPDLLILDEPFSGLDLFHIRTLEELLSKRGPHQITILSTHVAVHVAKICERAMTISEGQLLEIKAWKNSDFLTRLDLMEAEFFPKGDQH